MPAELTLHRLRTTQVDVEPDVCLIVLGPETEESDPTVRLKIHISGLPGGASARPWRRLSLFPSTVPLSFGQAATHRSIR